MARKLTAKAVARLRTPGRHPDATVPGLYLQISKTGARSFVMRYSLNKQPERMLGIGPASTLSLKEARDKARDARKLLLDGIDPIDHKRAERAAKVAAAVKAMTFGEAATRYFDQNQSAWSNDSHRDQFLSSLKKHAKPILGLDVATISLANVLACIEADWNSKAITMDRVRGRIAAVLDWSATRGHRSGENPARWAGFIDQVLPAPRKVAPIKHHAALNYAELPAFMVALRGDDAIASRALEFLILTAARSNEVLGAQWREFDLDNAVWVVPKERMKGRIDHRVPLSVEAVSLLRGLPHEDRNPFVFIGQQPGQGFSRVALRLVLKRLDRDTTVHGFRSSFRDWAGEQTSFAHDICEAVLAHVRGDQSVRAYARGDLFEKRRKLMDAWSRYACTPAPAKTDDVVGIGSGR
jgi:integrase